MYTLVLVVILWGYPIDIGRDFNSFETCEATRIRTVEQLQKKGDVLSQGCYKK